MGLCNVYNFSNNRTVKLSDSYSVQVKLTDLDMAKFKSVVGKYSWATDDILTLPECVSVTIPEVSLKAETYKYGNNSKVYVYPDYEKPDDLKIELIEHVVERYTDTNTKYIGVVELLVNIFLSKLFDAATYSYKLTDYIPELRIIVHTNDFTDRVCYYTFKNLKLSTYSKYTLDYSSSDLCKWSLVFSYQAYTQEFKPNAILAANDLFGENKSISMFSDHEEAPVIAEPAEEIITPSEATATLERPADEPTPVDTETAENNTEAIDTPVNQNDNTDKIDELAYQMMRGNLGNGKTRKENAKTAGYSDEEIAAAQAIVNQKDWNALRDRHNARMDAQAEVVTASNSNKVETTEPSVTTPSKAVETTPVNTDALANAATLANAKDLTAANEGTSTVMKSDTGKDNKLTAGSDDRIDELAYQMMRGTYDNGNPRIKKTLAADYTNEERKAAQKIVNKKEWNALKDRHDARVAAENERKTEALANANNGLTREPVKEETTPVVATTNNLGGDSADAAYKAALAKASETKPKENTVLASATPTQKSDTQEKKTNTESISTKTTKTKEDGKTVTTTTTVAQFKGFDADREKKIGEYAAKRYKEELAKGNVKNTQMLIEKIDMEARNAYAQGKL